MFYSLCMAWINILFIFLVASPLKSFKQVLSKMIHGIEVREYGIRSMISIPWFCRKFVITLGAWGLALSCWNRETTGCVALDLSTLLIY